MQHCVACSEELSTGLAIVSHLTVLMSLHPVSTCLQLVSLDLSFAGFIVDDALEMQPLTTLRVLVRMTIRHHDILMDVSPLA